MLRKHLKVKQLIESQSKKKKKSNQKRKADVALAKEPARKKRKLDAGKKHDDESKSAEEEEDDDGCHFEEFDQQIQESVRVIKQKYGDGTKTRNRTSEYESESRHSSTDKNAISDDMENKHDSNDFRVNGSAQSGQDAFLNTLSFRNSFTKSFCRYQTINCFNSL